MGKMKKDIEIQFKRRVISLLEQYGFKLEKIDGRIRVIPPQRIDRNTIKRIQKKSLIEMWKRIRLEDLEILKDYIASPEEIDVTSIQPCIELVSKNKDYEAIFRAARIFWETPVTNGFGRRIRIVVLDKNNGKLIGIIGLCDPVFNLRARDLWIGWDLETKKRMLWHVMNAYILGAVPPYNSILGGKLISLISISREIREIFRRKYKNKKSTILGIKRPPYLVLITTTTSFGKSIMLDRLHNNGHYYWRLIGYTSGFSPIIFDGDIYRLAKRVLKINADEEFKKYKFGHGPNFRFRILRKALQYVGLSNEIMKIGVKRGVYVAELAENTKEFLRGEEKSPKYFKNYDIENLLEYFRERWLFPRIDRLKRKIRDKYEEAKVRINKLKMSASKKTK